MPRTNAPERDKPVSMRAPQAEWELIDRAARLLGKTRTAFVLDAAKRQAEDVLKDRMAYTFTSSEWAELVAALDAPVSSEERRMVAALLGERPAWEQSG